MRQSDAGFAAYPRRADYRLLDVVIDDFTALGSLVLHAPLADLLKAKPRKLPSTSNTFRHVYLKDYQ
jgi:hypothetical protein